jgi:hypothetical protein
MNRLVVLLSSSLFSCLRSSLRCCDHGRCHTIGPLAAFVRYPHACELVRPDTSDTSQICMGIWNEYTRIELHPRDSRWIRVETT